MDYLAEIKVAIRQNHGCGCIFKGKVPVKEVFEGKVAWEGEVVVFDLIGHATAKRCFAWGYPPEDDAKDRQVFTVIDIPPVDSAETAIKFALAAHARKFGAPKSASK
jgi:hypothetical protein